MNKTPKDKQKISKNVLFVKISNATFINQDESILRESFNNCITITYSEKHHFISQLKLLGMLIYFIRKTDLVYIWFASYHSVIPTFIAQLFRRKSVLIIGGHDAAFAPELNYGAHLKKLRSWCVKVSCNYASIILTVSKFTHEQIFQFISDDMRMKTNMIYNGVDTDQFVPENVEREQRIITICGTNKVNICHRKGIDFFLNIAEFFLNAEFVIVGLKGSAMDWALRRKHNNVTLIGEKNPTELRQLLNSAKVICQFSRYEAFGLALAEGMAMGCIPVGYNYGGTPEIMGETGLLINEMNVNEAKEKIKKALQSPESYRQLVRNIIAEKFSTKSRQGQLITTLSKLLD